MSAAGKTLTIVTGADERYGRCLWQMLRSAERRGLHREHRFAAYDLGLSGRSRGAILRRFPWCALREGDLDALPPHAALAARTYAWKPILLMRAASEFGGLVLWLDSATLFRGDLDTVIDATRRHGVYTLAGQSQIQEHCEPQVWESLATPLEVLDLPERVAGVVGFDCDRPEALGLLQAWEKTAWDPCHWRPLSPRHKPEQAILSILLYQAAREGSLTLNPGEVDIGSPRPARWLSTRNKVAPWVPTAADPLVRAYFRAAKAVDRALIRLRRFKASRIDGWHRMPKEHYTVRIGPSGARPGTAVPSPRAGYYADPFVFADRGQAWLLVEHFSYARNAGSLVALPVGEDLRVGAPEPMDVPGRHLSFPAVLVHEGATYLVPESTANRTVDLYACEAFPRRWRLRRRLLANIDAADSVLHFHGGRWWLFTSVRDGATGGGRFLAIYHAEDLLAGPFIPHPVNRERRYASSPFDTGRSAGPFVRTADGTLLRPVHRSLRHYGEGFGFMRVTRLDTGGFEEAPCRPGEPWLPAVAGLAAHHVCVGGSITAADFRDRVSYAGLIGSLLPGSSAR